MDVLLFDNDTEQLALLEQTLNTLPGAQSLNISVSSHEDDLDARLAEGAHFDVAIMDIDLGEGRPSGIDIVKKHFGPQSPTQVVYLTGFVEYCTEVYETEHVYFLMKPATRDQLARALEKASEKLDREEGSITVVSNRSTVSIAPKRIIYAESMRRKTYIHLSGGEIIETRTKIASLQDALPPRFIQPHKSYLVNLDWVTGLDGSELKLANSKIVPISQSRRSITRDAFMGYLHRRG